MKIISLFTALLMCLINISASADDYSESAESFVKTMVENDFKQAATFFTEEAAAMLNAEKLQQIWSSLTGSLGKWEGIHEISCETVASLPVRIVKGIFPRSGLNIRLVFSGNGKIQGILFQPAGKPGWRKPDYVKSESFTEEPRQITCPHGNLPARLTLPVGSGKVPGVVLVHGSGPHDMDEAIGPNKPFRDIACGLASRGIAVLTYDKRTKTFGTEMKKFTLDNETVDDAVTAAKLLLTEPRVDSSRIFVLGHSQGGYALPRIAARFPQGKGWIALAGHDRPPESLIAEQVRHILSNTPGAEGIAKAHIEAVEKQAEKVRTRNYDENTPATELPAGITADWFISVRDYHPASMAASLPGKWLFLQGGRDYQVTVKDLESFRHAFNGKSNAHFRVYDSLNHLFMAGEGVCMPAEYDNEGSVAAEVISDMADFILPSHSLKQQQR